MKLITDPGALEALEHLMIMDIERFQAGIKALEDLIKDRQQTVLEMRTKRQYREYSDKETSEKLKKENVKRKTEWLHVQIPEIKRNFVSLYKS
jgi:Mn-containing catalase